jgi:SWI/SNF-related matrix-associated actin-dependent regulator of chromatin subfamily A3
MFIAHIIQNRATTIAKAASEIEARHRWAVTGTPIQNRLTDLASLFGFLRIYPYSNSRTFDREISQPWQQNNSMGCLRVKTLVNFVTLFRTKAVIDLPKRYDEVHHLDFSPAEDEIYQKIRTQTYQMFTNAITSKNLQKGVYINALQWLNQLRLFCNHGVMQSKMSAEFTGKGTWTLRKAQRMFDDMFRAGDALCIVCYVNLVDVTPEAVSANATELPHAKMFQCLHLICGSCIGETMESSRCPACPRGSGYQSFEVSTTSELSPRLPLSKTLPLMNSTDIPTKIVALLASLRDHKAGEKRSVMPAAFG